MGNSIKELNWVQRLAVKALGINQLQQSAQRFQNVVMSHVGVSVLWNSGNNVDAYTSNATVYAIVDRITEMAAIPEFKVFRFKKGNKNWQRDHYKIKAWTGENATYESVMKAMKLKSLVYEEDNNHPLNKLIEKPNKWQKRSEFVVNSVGFKLLEGERFLNVTILDAGADKGTPYEVYNLPPLYMQVLPDGTPYGVAGYRFVLGKIEDIPRENIIHSRYFNPSFSLDGSHLRGLSPLKVGRKNLTRSEAAIERSTATLQNAGAAGALFEKSGADESIEQAEDTKNKINNRINGTDNSGSISYLNGDYGYINFGQSAADMQVIESEKFSDIKLCNIYSFPPEILNPDNSTFNNSKEFDKQLITGAVIPELNSLRDDWNEIAKLYKDDIYVDYDLSAYPALQEDLDKVAARLEKMPYLTWNEKRLAVGQDEDTDQPLMNEYFVPTGLTPISQLGEPDLTTGLDEMDDDT